MHELVQTDILSPSMWFEYFYFILKCQGMLLDVHSLCLCAAVGKLLLTLYVCVCVCLCAHAFYVYLTIIVSVNAYNYISISYNLSRVCLHVL